MSDATEATGTPEAGEGQGLDLGPVADRVGQLVDERLGAFREDILGRIPSQEPDPEPETDPWAGLFGEDPEPEPEPQPQLNIDQLRQAVLADLRNEMAPIWDQVTRLGTSHDLGLLYEKHPDLKDPDVRQATGTEVSRLATAFEQSHGTEFADALRNSPEFVALVHTSLAGQKNAAAEVAATGDTTQLEGGGGAAPGGIEQLNIVQQALQNRPGAMPKGFR